MDHDLFKRLCRARDLLAASADQPIALADAATVAHLSKFHFLRMFARAFGQTPHAFVQHQRIHRARALLAHDRPVTEVCMDVGYTSLGSFSTLFRRETGESPEQFRRRTSRIFAIRWAAGPVYIPGCFIEHFVGSPIEEPQFRRSSSGLIVPT